MIAALSLALAPRLSLAPALALGLWATACFVFTVAAVNAHRAMRRRVAAAERARPVTAWPRLAILRPCEGLDPELDLNLLSAATAAYPGEREVLLLVPSASDPAFAACEQARAEAARLAPSVAVRVVETHIRTEANRKVAQLAAAMSHVNANANVSANANVDGPANLDAPILVVADSDVRFDDRTLPSLLSALCSDPRAGASSAAYLEVASHTAADRLSAALLSSTPHAFACLSGLSERSGGAQTLCGALLAIRPEALAAAGGWPALEGFLGEDFELARRLHQHGYHIPMAAAPARVMDRGRTLPQVVRRFSRWATVTRRQKPHLYPSYFLLLGCAPLLALAAGALALSRADSWPLAACAVAVALAVRVWLARSLRAAYGLPTGLLASLAALLAGEALILVSSTLALGRPTIEWRGHRYLVGPGGLLEKLRR